MQTEERLETRRRALIDQLLGVRRILSAVPPDRRKPLAERRNVTARSLLHGSIRPRRRGVRRASDVGPQYLDWHHPVLLVAVVGILLLCALDGFLTLELLRVGAEEVNPLMRQLIHDNLSLFAAAKMALTGAGIVLFVLHANTRLFRYLKVGRLLFVFLIAYALLIGYELGLLGYV